MKHPKHGLMATSSDYFGGNHCIMIVGWNDKTNCYKIKNSWGRFWGDSNGVAEVPKHEINYVYSVLDEELKIPVGYTSTGLTIPDASVPSIALGRLKVSDNIVWETLAFSEIFLKSP